MSSSSLNPNIHRRETKFLMLFLFLCCSNASNNLILYKVTFIIFEMNKVSASLKGTSEPRNGIGQILISFEMMNYEFKTRGLDFSFVFIYSRTI